MIFDEILRKNRRLRLEALKMSKDIEINTQLSQIISEYLDEYCQFHQLSAEDVIHSYDSFAALYQKDLHRFYETGKYPAELGDVHRTISRTDYDLALILSILLNSPRHLIFTEFLKVVANLNGQKILFIGIGAAIELFVIKKLNLSVQIDAYDISISQFVKEYFSEFHLVETLYDQPTQKYDYVFALELLEHLEQPAELSALCYKSLVKDGYFIATTATNMPQFDHLYNFVEDTFLKQMSQLGFSLVVHKDFIQPYSNSIISKNSWLILKV
jgi:2-polyprenyl-3-methyl-5-hydroxy-6-metoxy-1,4-benzoquinol methylase